MLCSLQESIKMTCACCVCLSHVELRTHASQGLSSTSSTQKSIRLLTIKKKATTSQLRICRSTTGIARRKVKRSTPASPSELAFSIGLQEMGRLPHQRASPSFRKPQRSRNGTFTCRRNFSFFTAAAVQHCLRKARSVLVYLLANVGWGGDLQRDKRSLDE